MVKLDSRRGGISTLDDALQGQIDVAIRTLKDGGVVAIPTDTLYGLAACAFDERAVARVFRLKGRHTRVSLPLLVADVEDIRRWAADIPDLAWALGKRFWPGALTLVLRKADTIPDIVCGGKGTIALRVPDHPVPRTITRELGAPITGTSANRSGKPGLCTAIAVLDEFGDEVDLVVDGGETSAGLPSTVLDLSGEEPRILREGAVAKRDIEELCVGQLAG